MKSNANIRIVLFSLAILVLLGILGSVILVRTFMINISESGIMDVANEILTVNRSDEVQIDGNGYSDEYDAMQIHNLEIDWVSESIIIHTGETDMLRFEESSVTDPRNQMIAKRSGDKLTLEFCDENAGKWNFGVNALSEIKKDLVITVPQSWICDTLEINTASARVEISDLMVNDLDFDGASGLCIFNNCSIDRLDIDTASGDVQFIGILDSLDFDAASANFRGTFQNVPDTLDVDSMSGDLEITLPEKCGFTLHMDTLSGDFSSDFQTSISSGRYIYGDGSCRISVNAMSGNVHILKGN